MLQSSGKIEGGLYAIGDHRLPAYLLLGENPVLFINLSFAKRTPFPFSFNPAETTNS